MKSLNEKETLWSNLDVEKMETREEYASCFHVCINCIDCFCIKISCISF